MVNTRRPVRDMQDSVGWCEREVSTDGGATQVESSDEPQPDSSNAVSENLMDLMGLEEYEKADYHISEALEHIMAAKRITGGEGIDRSSLLGAKIELENFQFAIETYSEYSE